MRPLKVYPDKGSNLKQSTSFTLSPKDCDSGSVFMTRYLLSNPADTK